MSIHTRKGHMGRWSAECEALDGIYANGHGETEVKALHALSEELLYMATVCRDKAAEAVEMAEEAER